MNLDVLFNQYNTKSLYGRYIILADIEPILFTLNKSDNLKIIGKSVNGLPIYTYSIGKGHEKVLLWSQMHGNESTTTKALIDLLQFLNSNSDFANNLLNDFAFCCLPMLNPDGAVQYTRENANNIDLNRDFQALSQPESKLLMQVFNEFKPDYCYNLHDQRTIYGAGNTGKPASISFLAPSYNENRDFNTARTEACRIINAMNSTLQVCIPNQIGRFDDSFNNNCCGDSFQELGVPTILFEAGHCPGDYDRETARKYIFFALISSLISIKDSNESIEIIEEYLRIPQNKVNFYDYIIRNVRICYEFNNISTNIAIQFVEELNDNKIQFIPYIVEIGELNDFFGHVELDAENNVYKDNFESIPKINSKAEFTIGNRIEFNAGKLLNN